MARPAPDWSGVARLGLAGLGKARRGTARQGEQNAQKTASTRGLARYSP
jgi:hypothetical protein